MVTGMWHVMEPREKWDTYSCSDLAHCIWVCICWQAKLSFSVREAGMLCLASSCVAQKETLLEGAKLLSELYTQNENVTSDLLHWIFRGLCLYLLIPALKSPIYCLSCTISQKRWWLHLKLNTEEYINSTRAIKVSHFCFYSDKGKEEEYFPITWHDFLKVLKYFTHYAKCLFANSNFCFIICNFVSSDRSLPVF